MNDSELQMNFGNVMKLNGIYKSNIPSADFMTDANVTIGDNNFYAGNVIATGVICDSVGCIGSGGSGTDTNWQTSFSVFDANLGTTYLRLNQYSYGQTIDGGIYILDGDATKLTTFGGWDCPTCNSNNIAMVGGSAKGTYTYDADIYITWNVDKWEFWNKTIDAGSYIWYSNEDVVYPWLVTFWTANFGNKQQGNLRRGNYYTSMYKDLVLSNGNITAKCLTLRDGNIYCDKADFGSGGSVVDTNWETSFMAFDANMKATYQPIGNYVTKVSLDENLLPYITIAQSDTNLISYTYSKSEQDINWAKYQLLGNYITIAQADANYQPKFTLENYITIAQADTNYWAKSNNFVTKTSLDGNLLPYITIAQADTNYFPKAGGTITGATTFTKSIKFTGNCTKFIDGDLNIVADVTNCTTLSVNSNNTTSTNRTFCITAGTEGQILYLIADVTGTNEVELPDGAAGACSGSTGAATYLTGVWPATTNQPNDVIILIYHTTDAGAVADGWFEMARAAN